MSGKTTPAIPRPEDRWFMEDMTEALDVTPEWIYQRRHHGQAPGSLARKLGLRLIWDPEEVRRWWAEGADPNWTPNGSNPEA